MREIVLDTETTGTEALKGDRIVEIGCIELMNHVPTGQTYHVYLNPERPMSEGAFRVHGLSDAFLSDKPIFADIAEAFGAFIDGARLIIHNASFDIGFLEMEFGRLGLPMDKSEVVDTLTLARRKHPGASNSLDALCQRYGIDNRKRVRHGALLDAELLAEVYLELIGGKQTAFSLAAVDAGRMPGSAAGIAAPVQGRPVPLPARLTENDIVAHQAFTGAFPVEPLWNRYVIQTADEDNEVPTPT